MTDHATQPPELEADDPYRFTPVPTRTRRDGWTADTQRAFIAALRRTGQVAVAAREVGMSHQSARQLRARPHAESFAAAWDVVLDAARGDALDAAIARATQGVLVPRTYRGRFVRLEHRNDDRALMTALRMLHASAPGS